MVKEKCYSCGKPIRAFEAELTQDYNGMKKGDIIELEGCKDCSELTQVGHRPKKKGGRHSSHD